MVFRFAGIVVSCFWICLAYWRFGKTLGLGEGLVVPQLGLTCVCFFTILYHPMDYLSLLRSFVSTGCVELTGS